MSNMNSNRILPIRSIFTRVLVVAIAVLLTAGCTGEEKKTGSTDQGDVITNDTVTVINQLGERLPGIVWWQAGCIGPDEVRVMVGHSVDTVTVPVGRVLCVEVEDNLAIGQRWRVSDLDSTLLRPEQAFFKRDSTKEGRTLGDGMTYYRFTALRPGESLLKLHRGFEPREDYNRTELIVQVESGPRSD